MSNSAPDEFSIENPLCNSNLGSMVTLDYETPLTGYEPKKDLNLVDAEELDLVTTSDIYWQHTLDDDASLNDPNIDDNELAEFFAVVVESTGKPVEMRSNNDQFSRKNDKSNWGFVQARIAEERESSNTQIRTMLDVLRRMIIAECSEKVITNSWQLKPNKIRKILEDFKNYRMK